MSGAALIGMAGAGSAAAPARNGLIAFAHMGPPEQIDLVRSDGHGLRVLRTRVSPSYAPAWSPSGRWLAFRGGREDDLYIIKPDGSGLRRLTHDTASEDRPAWSPNGKTIAFDRYRRGVSSIYAITLAGGKMTRLTTGAPDDDGEPSWSPDGSEIAFTRQRPSNGYQAEIWVMDADGSHQRRIYTGASDPVWAPTGHRLLIADDRQLFVWHLGSGYPRPVVTLHTNSAGETEDASPKWSPDGTKIVFDQLNRNGGGPGGSDVWIVNADGHGLHRLTRPADPAHPNNMPSWQPRIR